MRDSLEDNTLLPKSEVSHEQEEASSAHFDSVKQSRIRTKTIAITVIVTILTILAVSLLGAIFSISARKFLQDQIPSKCDAEESKKGSKVPQYFQTSPELWAGPTATGRAPFLAQTNPVSFAPTISFVPNTPLETGIPIVGQKKHNDSIFHLMGQLSPYFPNPVGFGVAEYPLPEGANITQVQVC